MEQTSNRPGAPQDEFEFEDSESSKSGAGSFKEILLRQYSKCILEGSKEMTKGGVLKRLIDNKVYEFPVPNQFEIFTNSVGVLKRMLKSQIEAKDTPQKIKDLIMDFYTKEKNRVLTKQKGFFEVENWLNEIKKNSMGSEEHIRAKTEQAFASCREIEKSSEEIELSNYYYLLESLGVLLDHLKYFEDSKTAM